MDYEFGEQIGLVVRATYPVRRGNSIVEVEPDKLSLKEATAIHLAMSKLLMEFSPFLDLATKREMKLIWALQTEEEREGSFTDTQVRIRGKGWLKWNELTPAQQAKRREAEVTEMAAVRLLPEQEAEVEAIWARRRVAGNSG